jgi:ribosome-associated toxin RatA of RatAB toxin-antitoxin module
MMVAEASTLVAATPDRVRAAVLDPDSYTQGDTKVAQIHVEERLPDGMVARIDGGVGPFRSYIRARYTVHPDRVDLDMLEGRLRGFHATFQIEPEGERVRLTHREEYDFGYGPFDPLVEASLQGWATRSVEAEVEALRRAAEAGLGATTMAPRTVAP